MRFDKLKRLVDPARPITYGIVQAGPEFEGGIPYIRPADMMDETGVKDFGSIKHTSPEIAQQYRRSAVKTGDLIISIGPSFGKVMEVPAELDGANLTQGTARVAPGRNLHARFAFWCLRSHHCYSQWEASIGGATFRALNLGPLSETRIPLPDLATQRQIADFLDRETARIDLLIEKKRRLVALLGEKYEATAAQLSTGERSQEDKFDSGIDWLGSIPKSWSIEKLSWHFYAAKGKDAQKYTKEYCGANEGEFPVYSGQTANEGVMGRIDTYDYDFGETGVLFATTVGAKAMDLRHLQGKFSLSQNCMIIIPRQQIPLKFYLYQMRVLFRKERQLIPDHMQASFRVEDLYRYRIAVPPPDLASEIGAKIEKAEAALKAVVEPVNASIDRLKEYRSALITAAVTGQIDVTTYAKSGTPDRRLDAIQEEMGA
ncbi:restriction endonuclease subunit S [Nioella ostreopsis]|uniref:restriction endonuclease subunit S n=1 Tax=Nioella ostreopsis TaxID=2448479 RepID=UPI000FDBA5E5|nr:restriction endonuclease subunit S [Nioella ostreopsis]